MAEWKSVTADDLPRNIMGLQERRAPKRALKCVQRNWPNRGFIAVILVALQPFVTSPASAATVDGYVTTDSFGICVPEAALDDPAIWQKGAAVPRTCLPPDTPWNSSIFEWATGRALTPEEWAAFSYRWLTLNRPDEQRFVGILPPSTGQGETPPSPVPAPPAGAFLAFAIALLIRPRRKR